MDFFVFLIWDLIDKNMLPIKEALTISILFFSSHSFILHNAS